MTTNSATTANVLTSRANLPEQHHQHQHQHHSTGNFLPAHQQPTPLQQPPLLRVQRSLSRDDSLEYFIKFPSIHSTTAAAIDGNDGRPAHLSHPQNAENHAMMLQPETDVASFMLNDTNNVPIVLLLGWAGCQDKYLMKYSKIYEDRGLITIRYTAPVENLFWKRNAMKPIGEKILKLIFDMNFDQHPLIFHVFSNGGAYLYQHIALAIRNSKRPLQVQGTIFDSAPGDRKMIGLYRAISAIYGKQKPLNSVVALLVTIGLMLVWFVEDMYHRIKFMFRTASDPAQANPFHNLKDEENRWPQLFMYSRKDLLIPYTDVERFAKYRQNRHGIHVQMVCFEEAEHVKLLTSQPQRYIQTVCKFINDCLAVYQCNKFNTNSKID